MKKLELVTLLSGALLSGCVDADVQLDLIELPLGFSIEVYAEGVENARQMVRGTQGTVF
ncbi:MAG: sorbosone dehydrogenase family protein, partial [Gammaproteobacteria bacterium]|nr:sorbosone dehydrogenase family protein [Gammaproteobacteria bacterium]